MRAAVMTHPAKLVGRTIPLEEAGAVLAPMIGYSTVGVPVVDRYRGRGSVP